jgi:pyruvate dehydrogenase E2 component (dihydrolipoamide acetyltransferase)
MGTFVMPSLGADMEAGTLVEWLKQPGDEVKHGDIIAVVETEKGAIEVEVFEDGRLDTLLVEPGTKVPVGTPLAEIAGEGGLAAKAKKAPPKAAPKPAPKAKPKASPRAPAKPAAAGFRATPAARKLAEERGVDIAGLKGSGPDGAITREDVLGATAEAPPAKGADLAPMRRAIAAAMARSKREIPHYYLSHSFDVSAAQDWIEAYNAERPPPERLLFGALLLKAVALALRDFPEFNGFHDGSEFTPSEAIHVGTAIAIRGGGLVAPAIHNTDALPLAELMVKMRDLVGRVRRGGFRSSEISDPTVTVSSLGERGVEALLPVIYPPQVAIIGFGAVLPRPWAVGDGVAVRPVVTATLAADHRASDGHRGALLLRRIAELLEQLEAL